MFPEIGEAVAAKETQVAEDLTRITAGFSNEDMAIINRARELLSHVVPDKDFAQSVRYLANYYIQHEDPLAKTASVKRRTKQSHARNVWEVRQRQNDCCQFVDEKTGHACLSRDLVEIDHIISVAIGGTDAAENLRCLCRTHNQLLAQELFGQSAAIRAGGNFN